MHTREGWNKNKLWNQPAVSDEPFMKDEDDSEESRKLPPRSLIHPSEKGTWTRRFYRLLLILFVLLLVGLFLWGNHYTSKSEFVR
jgi:hypothetical protein